MEIRKSDPSFPHLLATFFPERNFRNYAVGLSLSPNADSFNEEKILGRFYIGPRPRKTNVGRRRFDGVRRPRFFSLNDEMPNKPASEGSNWELKILAILI